MENKLNLIVSVFGFWLVGLTVCSYGQAQANAEITPQAQEAAETHESNALLPEDVTPASLDDENLEAIRNATVLITMQTITTKESGQYSVIEAYGLGSLVSFPDNVLLVTHNHWGDMLDGNTAVKFYDAENHLIHSMAVRKFKELTLDANPGVLILQAPDELLETLLPIRYTEAHPVTVGDVVSIAYRENPDRKKVAIQQAVIEQVTTLENHQVYQVNSLDGQVIQPGDSGGGLWLDGEFVGLNWMTEEKELTVEASPTDGSLTTVGYTGTSYAAAFKDIDF